VGLALIGTSAVAATLTKVWIEDPLRLRAHNTTRNNVRGLGLLISLSIVLALAATALSKPLVERRVKAAEKLYRQSLNPGECFGGNAALSGANCPNLHGLDERDYVLQAWSNQIHVVPNGNFCQNARRDETVKPCSFGAKEGDERVRLALFGDSHATMWAAGLATFAERDGLRIDMYTASACPPTLSDDLFADYMPPRDRSSCAHWRREAIKRIASDPRVKYVMTTGHVIAHRRLRADGSWMEDDGSGYVSAWTAFLNAGKKIIVIDDVPMLPFYFADCLALNHGNAAACSYERTFGKEASPFAKAVSRMGSNEILLINFEDVLCDTAKCYAVVGGIPVYMDRGHVSAPFARSVSSVLRNAIINIGE
jgi:hypothetical protein